MNDCNGHIRSFDLPLPVGRVYKALIEVTIGLTVEQKDERIAAGERLPEPWPLPHQALIDTGSQHTHVKKAIVGHLGLEPISELEIGSSRLNGEVTFGRQYRVHLSCGDGLGKDVIVVAGAAESIPHDMIIGADFLIDYILVWNGPESVFTISLPLSRTSGRRGASSEKSPQGRISPSEGLRGRGYAEKVLELVRCGAELAVRRRGGCIVRVPASISPCLLATEFALVSGT